LTFRFVEALFSDVNPHLLFQLLREAAVNALRAALVLVAQRETARQSRSQHQSWYTAIYKECVRSMDYFDSSNAKRTSDFKHGGLLVMAELFRASNAEWERRNRDIEETILCEAGGGLEANGGSGLAGSLGSVDGVTTTPPEKLRGLGAMRQYYRANFGRGHNKNDGQSGGGGGHQKDSSSSSYIPFSWFGTVMVGKEPVVESALCKKMLSDHYDGIAANVISLTKSPQIKPNCVRNALLILLPRLAAFKRKRFIEKFLTPTMHYLDRQLQDKNKYNVFLAIGLLSVAVGEEIESHLRNILTHIKISLPSPDAPPNKKRPTALDPAIFACISMLARAVRHRIKNEVADMLDSMLSVGLSSSLTTALHELAIYIPAFKREIADGLLKILSLILMRQPFRHPGTPKRLLSPTNQMTLGPPDAAPDVPFIVLGLRILGTFDFEGHSLLQFVRHCADNYLLSEHKSIRLEAVKTCSSLLKGTLRSLAGRRSDTVISTINEVLAKLLIVGITDQESDVRSTVMDCLDDCFDYHLAQAENLSALFVAMNDEVFEIREQTTCIIGRLSVLNPAYIMPTLRKTLFQLLTEMEYSGVGRNKEQSARMIGHLVANAPTVIRPYVDPILKVLVPKLKETDLNPMVITSVLRAVGDLAQVGGILMCRYVDELLPILLDKLTDASSSQKREVALWTLAQLVENTGCVTEPYVRYPNFLETLLNFLRTEQRGTIRGQTLRLLGLLGALDPYRHKMAIGEIDSSSVTSAALIPINDSTNEMELSFEMSPSELLVNMGSNCSLEDFYPSVAISALMRIIRDPTLSQYHTEVVQAVTYIFRALGIKSVPYIPQVIPSMINVIRSMDVKFHDNLLRQLGILISIVRQHIRNYLDDIFKLIRDFWTPDSPLQPTLISLAEHISLALGSEFKIYLPQLIPQMIRVLSYDSSKDRYVTGILLAALRKFGATLNDYMNLILPKIVALFDSAETPMNIRRAALECIDHLSDSLDFSEYASLIIHPLTRCLDTCPELRLSAMDTLAAIVAQLGKKYVMFVPLVRKVLIRHKISHQRYDILYARVMQGGGSQSDFDDTLMRYPSNRSSRRAGDDGLGGTDAQAAAAGAATVKKLPTSANLANLQAAWAVSRRVSKDDWLDW
jgi:FKBP12-rapamycin complex-associated protein